MYVGNLDFASDAASVASGLARLLGPALASSARATEVPGWVDRRRADGTPKPRKKRDAGKRNRGFAVLEFPDADIQTAYYYRWRLFREHVEFFTYFFDEALAFFRQLSRFNVFDFFKGDTHAR
mgnify:CR=1 FL=1